MVHVDLLELSAIPDSGLVKLAVISSESHHPRVTYLEDKLLFEV
jgi:hypothetical protein